MIQRRAHNKFAPIPMNYQPEHKLKKYISKTMEHKPLKLSKYWMEMHTAMFRRWE